MRRMFVGLCATAGVLIGVPVVAQVVGGVVGPDRSVPAVEVPATVIAVEEGPAGDGGPLASASVADEPGSRRLGVIDVLAWENAGDIDVPDRGDDPAGGPAEVPDRGPASL